jgi:23S rRNA (guanine745-N1)-methyltransferase
MFGFPVYPEFARVLKPGGLLLQVDVGSDHLRELREIIYPSLKPERAPNAAVPDGFARLSEEVVRYALTLDSREQISDLLLMTPHLFRATAEGRAKAAALTTLALTVDVRLARFIRVD